MSTRPKYPMARLSPAKDGLLVYAITRESVIARDIAPLLDKLRPLSQSRELALRYEGHIAFYFEGWEHDPREIAAIPEIRAYFAALTEAWPYWLHFIEKVGETFSQLLCLLCRGEYVAVRDGMACWSFADLNEVQNLVLRLFADMNGLYETLDLPEALNERISQEIAQLLECSLLPEQDA